MKQRHPHCSSIRSPHTGESVLQRCVLVRSNDVLKALLEGDSKVGFVRDSTGNTALKVALVLEKRRCVETLLEAVTSGRVGTSDLSPVTECIPLLHSSFPELLLDFIGAMQLDDARGIDHAEDTIPMPESGWGQYVRGTAKRTEPRNLWEDIYHRARETRGSLRNGETRVEMVAKQIPFENFVGWHDDYAQSPFHVRSTKQIANRPSRPF